MTVSNIARMAVLAAWFLTISAANGFSLVANPSAFVRHPSSPRTTSELSMALALPTPQSKKRRWYEETLMPIKQRVVYNDDFDVYDEFGRFRGNAPFRGIKSAPIVFTSSSSSSAAMAAPQRKRDKLKRAALWVIQKVRRS